MRSAPVFLMALAGLLAGCKPDPDPIDTHDPVVPSDPDPATPVLTVQAPNVFLLVGESVQLSVVTTNGEDSAYAWETSDAGVATVVEGTVTGVSPGEVWVTVTGADTEATAGIGLYVSQEVPYQAEWAASAHAAHADEAFSHWDEDGAVPATCARCHTTTGFRDYLGDDGSAPHSVEADVPAGEVVSCMACHNPTASELDHVLFPSGVHLEGLGPEARCMTCHQGRASKDDVDASIAQAGAADHPDTVEPGLSFTNIHYYAAGATLNAGRVRGGYQYDDVSGITPLYDVRFRHVEGYDTCTGCHDPHSLEVRVEQCAECHTGVSTVEDLRDVRMISSSTVDYDGDGDLTEGIYYELQGVKEVLYAAMQAYAADRDGVDPICYDPSSYPYYFVDSDGSGGFCSASEATFANGYKTWTPRLLRAAYNYQVAGNDPGAFAHNAKYMIQLMHDSIQDLSGATGAPVPFTGDRDDPGHFDGASQAFRNWDGNEQVTASCSRCHGGKSGFLFHLQFGSGIAVLETPNGMECETCHSAEFFRDPASESLWNVPRVTFPGGKVIAAADMYQASDALCASCHSGRQGKGTIDAYLASTSNPSFQNVHYLPSAGMKYGAEAGVGYEYDGKTYAGADPHMPQGANSECVFCHSPAATGHTFQPADHFGLCVNCHTGSASVEEIRWFGNTVDYDGDGDAGEPLAAELATYKDALLTALRTYADAHDLGAPCYSEHAYPYWFTGEGPWCTPGEATGANAFRSWDGELVKAAHNFQFVHKDPGAWAHNMTYATQLLYDSIEALGADPAPLVRP